MAGTSTPSVVLPDWAVVGEKRRAHIARVTHLLGQWSTALHLPPDQATAWHDAGRWHDALRDADEPALRRITGDAAAPADILHGPAAAMLLEAGGETRREVLEAIRWHTIGCATWSRTGQALYMADFLEPGRAFMATERGFLAAQLPHDFPGVFRQVVRMRMEWLLREGRGIFRETVDLWNQVR